MDSDAIAIVDAMDPVTDVALSNGAWSNSNSDSGDTDSIGTSE